MEYWLVVAIVLQLWSLKETTGCKTVINATFDTTLEDELRQNPSLILGDEVQLDSPPGSIGGGAAGLGNKSFISVRFVPSRSVSPKIQFKFRFQAEKLRITLTHLVKRRFFFYDTNNVSVVSSPRLKTFTTPADRVLVRCRANKPTPTSAFHDFSLEFNADGVTLDEDLYEMCRSAHTVYPPRGTFFLAIDDTAGGYIDELVVREQCG